VAAVPTLLHLGSHKSGALLGRTFASCLHSLALWQKLC
jgi:hypothetical protein